MKRRALFLAVLPAALVLIPLNALAAQRYVNLDGLCGGNSPCYTDLASAIAASNPGDVILVQAGLYSVSSTILIDRSVTILGPQNGVNPVPRRDTPRVPGDPLSEAIFDGNGSVGIILRITADNVTIDGIEVRNGTGDLIDSPAGTRISGTAVRNCIIHQALGDEGIQLRDQVGALIECNHVYDTAGDGINLCCGSTNGAIRNNEIHNIASQDAALYVYNSTNTTIEGNLIYATTNNDGIKLGAKDGSDATASGGIIIDNTIRYTAQDGIALYSSNTTVRCNGVTNSLSENGGIYLAFAVSNNLIEDNFVLDNTFNTAKWGDPAGIMIGTDVDVPSTVVRNNNVEGNLPNGMTNKGTGTLDARGNWWGDASGPGGAGPGLGAAVSTNVDFSSWLTSPTTVSCPPPGSCDMTPTPAFGHTWGEIKIRYR